MGEKIFKCHANVDRVCDDFCPAYALMWVSPFKYHWDDLKGVYAGLQTRKPVKRPYCQSGGYVIGYVEEDDVDV